MDDRLTDDFIREMTRRYGRSALVQLLGVGLSVVAPTVGVAVVLLAAFFCLIPQANPRYKPGQEPGGPEVNDG